jgi:hypothetical protein
MQDAISAISDVNRELVLNAEAQADVPGVRLGIRFFNTFLREAVKRKDVHAIFDVFQQYKELARDLFHNHAELAIEVGRHLKYYADFARITGMHFIYELGCYDLESMVEWAYKSDAAKRREMLDVLLSFDAPPLTIRLVKAKIIAGGFFRERGLEAEEEAVRRTLVSAPPTLIEQGLRDLVETLDPIFWEVTDRQTNIDYVDETRKRAIKAFVASLQSSAEAVAASARSAMAD